LAVSATAQPQDAFPNRALRIIVPFTPGGGQTWWRAQSRKR